MLTGKSLRNSFLQAKIQGMDTALFVLICWPDAPFFLYMFYIAFSYCICIHYYLLYIIIIMYCIHDICIGLNCMLYIALH